MYVRAVDLIVKVYTGGFVESPGTRPESKPPGNGTHGFVKLVWVTLCIPPLKHHPIWVS